MSDLKTALERIADSAVSGIALQPLHEAPARRRVRSRRVVALGGACLMVAAVAIAASVRTSDSHHPALGGGSHLVADVSYSVPSAGMSPTLEVGDVVSGATTFGSIEGGDVVRLHLPGSVGNLPIPPGSEDGFKRVIGLPGDTVEGRAGAVFVNGRELREPYAVGTTSDFPRAVVPRGTYFLLGDNRANSLDSRVWGPVQRSAIIAIALKITAPADRAGAIAGSPR